MKWAADQRLDDSIGTLLDLSEQLRRRRVAVRDEDVTRRELCATAFLLSDEAVRRAKAALARMGEAYPVGRPQS